MIAFEAVVIKIIATIRYMNRHWMKSLRFPMYFCDHLQVSAEVLSSTSSLAPYILPISLFLPKMFWISKFLRLGLLEFELLTLPLGFLLQDS